MTDKLIAAARAVVERWDSPLWKDLPHTAEYIAKLREALDELAEQKEEMMTDKLSHGLFCELWAAAQLAPGEGIQDGADRIGIVLREALAEPAQPQQPLSEIQLERLYANIPPTAQQDARSREAFKRLARIIEAAHGITQTGEKP